MIAFGPVNSRRLGKSLGINTIPGRKVCSYACIYCQVGETKLKITDRTIFYEPKIIYKEVKEHLSKLNKENEPDFLTLVSNGEPTLDINMGEIIEMLKDLGYPVAVITNASLLIDSEVRNDLNKADLVSLKIDTADEIIWQQLNRPHERLNFKLYQEGLSEFAECHKNRMITEIMLIKGLNDFPESLEKTAQLLSSVHPETAYLSIPTRPPAVSFVEIPDENIINNAYQIFCKHQINTELLVGFEGTDTGFTGNAIEDILNICAVHPIRDDTMRELLKRENSDLNVLDSLIQNGYIKEVYYQSHTYFLRKFHI
jgi:wyosine [tRNA(Phe)-imidazoG37] synthetase (radical SAM superfamily)